MAHTVNLLLVFIVTVVGVVFCEEGEELNINVLYKPDDCARSAKAGDYVTLTYNAFIPTETGNERFDTSDNTGPALFRLHDAESTAMKGWHQAVDGMCLQEKREVLIPAGELTINHRLPNSKVPPAEQDILYRFTLHDLSDAPVENLFSKMDYDGNMEISKEELGKFLETGGVGGIDQLGGPEKAAEHVFQQMDRDEDGVVSHAEFPGRKHDEF